LARDKRCMSGRRLGLGLRLRQDGMGRHESFMARLAQIAREYELPLRGQELVQSRLRWEDWESLRAETAAFAKKEIRRRKWRGARGGVLPGGCDAEDIADQAIGELLSGKGRVAIGFVRERLVRELKRLVSGKIRVLHGLREARATRSEWDVLPVKEGDGPVSFFAGLLDGGASTDETADERAERRDHLKAEFARCLDGEPELKAVFGCLCAGVTKPGEIARRLGMGENAVTNARKRLDRRLAALCRAKVGRVEGRAG
jgi:hypothetical protein